MSAKVLLVVIDAATPHAVCPAIRTGRLPVLQQLVERGALHESSVSIFPSITPAATSSIATGAYPDEHGIAGASWYDVDKQEIAYYGDDFWVIAREGIGSFLEDFLVRLNGDRLRAPTMFQMIERTGRVAASLNYLVFKGDRAHDVRLPGALAALPGATHADRGRPVDPGARRLRRASLDHREKTPQEGRPPAPVRPGRRLERRDAA